MLKTRIQVFNETDFVKDDEIRAVLPAMETQVHRDFAKAWGVDAELEFVEKGRGPDQDAWWIVFLKNSNQAGALGYHMVTRSGLPLGKVLMEPIIQDGSSWTNTLSHELLEMLADPDSNLVAYRQINNGRLVLHAYEVCDPCEDDSYGYKIDGVLVSDFVYPSWFESFHKGASTRFDHGRHISKPFELLPGGYIDIFDASSGKGWYMRNAGSRAKSAPTTPCSRIDLRHTPRGMWKKSEVKRRPRRE